MKRIALLCFVWIVPVATVVAELPTIDWVTTTWGTGRIRLKFEGDRFEMRYLKELTPQMRELGFTDIPVKGGRDWPVPNYVLNVHSASLATKRKWAGGGYPIVAGEPGIVYVDWPWVTNAAGLYSTTVSEVVNSFLSPSIYVRGSLSPNSSISTTVHEWTHAAQASELGMSHQWYGYWKGFQEGTAVWAEDLPMEFDVHGVQVRSTSRPAGMRSTDLSADSSVFSGRSINLDDMNMPNRRYAADLSLGYNQNFLLRNDGYGSHLFWKYFAQRAKASESQVGTLFREDSIKAIMEYGKAANSRSFLDYGAFLRTSGNLLPEEGTGPIKNFRVFFEDFTAAMTRFSSKGGDRDRFMDDAFDSMSVRDSAIGELRFSDTPSIYPSSIPVREARNEEEIKRRLASIAKESDPISALGWAKGGIELGRSFGILTGEEFIPPPFDRRRLFLLVLGNHKDRGESEMTLAALSAHGDQGRISPNVTMERLRMSLQSSKFGLVNDRYSAYLSLGSFHTEGNIERVNFAVGNVSSDGSPLTAAVGCVVAPRFQKYVPTKWNPSEGLSGGPKSVWLVSSQPQRAVGTESMRGGETLEYEVGVSAEVHLGFESSFSEKETTLKVTLLSPGKREVKLENLSYAFSKDSVKGTKARMPAYRVRFKLPEELEEEGLYSLRFDVSSLLRLGPDDRDRSEVTFLAGGESPQVTSVRVKEGDETYYDSLFHVFRPVPPGEYKLLVAFDQKLDSAVGKTEIKLGNKTITGTLDKESRLWEGELKIPEAVETFAEWQGLKSMQISAVSAKSIPLDSDSETEGDQPDTEHKIFFGLEPPRVTRLSAEADGKLVYYASWKESEDDESRKDWRAGEEGVARRKLEYETRERISETVQEVRVEFVLSSQVEKTPTVTIDDEAVVVTGSNTTWGFAMPIAKKFENADPASPIQIEIIAADRYGFGLDSDPATLLEISENGDWIGYEHAFSGGVGDGKGGPDLWHQLNLETDPEWLEENRKGRRQTFTLLQRGDEMIARFDGLDYRGLRSRGGNQWTLRADPSLEYSLSSPWYDQETGERIPNPARAIREAYLRGADDLYYLKKVNEVTDPESSWKFQGEEHTFTLRWDDEEKLTQVQPPSRWTQIRWKPIPPKMKGPKEETKPDKELSEDLPAAQSVTTLTAYQLEERIVGGMKIVSVERVAYRQQGEAGARLVVTSYPVSYLEDRTGDRGLLYNVQWSSGRETMTKFTTKSETVSEIRAEYDRFSEGGFSRGELDSRLQTVFGESSRPLEAQTTP